MWKWESRGDLRYSHDELLTPLPDPKTEPTVKEYFSRPWLHPNPLLTLQDQSFNLPNSGGLSLDSVILGYRPPIPQRYRQLPSLRNGALPLLYTDWRINSHYKPGLRPF
jgi:hypothetical protein